MISKHTNEGKGNKQTRIIPAVIMEPGATMLEQAPKLEKEERVSVESEESTA